MILTTGALIAAGIAAAGATAGAAGSAANRRKARSARNAYYDYADDVLRSQYYRDPLSTAGNRAILKSMDERLADQTDAIQNRAVAGGATMENVLAARQSNNRTMGNVYSSLLQGEDARRRAIEQQRLQLAGRRASDESNSYLQAAQDWSQWGSQIANAALSYGSSSLLGASGTAPTFGDVAGNPVASPILGQAGVPQVSGPQTVTAPPLGGLRGVRYENGVPVIG